MRGVCSNPLLSDIQATSACPIPGLGVNVTTAAASQLSLCSSDAAIHNQPQNETSLTAKAQERANLGS